MSVPSLAPRSPRIGVGIVWLVGLLISVGVGIFAPSGDRAGWLCAGLGACLIVAFAVQIFSGRAQGFIVRISASILGALLIMGIVSVGFLVGSVLNA